MHSEKLVVGLSAARKKTVSYSKHKVEILIANRFQESKMFPQTFFSIRTFTCNTQETLFVGHKLLFCHLPAILRYHFRALK